MSPATGLRMVARFPGTPGLPDFEVCVEHTQVDYVRQLLHLRFLAPFYALKDNELKWMDGKEIPFLHIVWLDPDGDEVITTSFEKLVSVGLTTTVAFAEAVAVTVDLALGFRVPHSSPAAFSGW